MAQKYRAQCKSHDWEGWTRDDRERAVRDLDEHIMQVDGNHDSSIDEWNE